MLSASKGRCDHQIFDQTKESLRQERLVIMRDGQLPALLFDQLRFKHIAQTSILAGLLQERLHMFYDILRWVVWLAEFVHFVHSVSNALLRLVICYQCRKEILGNVKVYSAFKLCQHKRVVGEIDMLTLRVLVFRHLVLFWQVAAVGEGLFLSILRGRLLIRRSFWNFILRVNSAPSVYGFCRQYGCVIDLILRGASGWQHFLLSNSNKTSEC